MIHKVKRSHTSLEPLAHTLMLAQFLNAESIINAMITRARLSHQTYSTVRSERICLALVHDCLWTTRQSKSIESHTRDSRRFIHLAQRFVALSKRNMTVGDDSEGGVKAEGGKISLTVQFNGESEYEAVGNTRIAQQY